MYPVTADFIDKIMASYRQVFGKVIIDFTDPFIDQYIVATVNENGNSFPAQTANQVADPVGKHFSYDGSCSLDGTYSLAPETAAGGEFGWWGTTLAGAGGSFGLPYPTLTVELTARPIHSLKVVGDSARQEYPVDFDIDLYIAGNPVPVYTGGAVGNALLTWTLAITPVLQVAKMTLKIKKWSHVGRQVKIMEFYTSIQQIYEGDDLVRITLLEEREINTNSLPVGSASSAEIGVLLNNIDDRFTAGNTLSPLYGLLRANRRIKAWLGIEAENSGASIVPTFTRASVAYKQDGSSVASGAPRYEAGKFGQALTIEGGTTNLVTYSDPTALGQIATNGNVSIAAAGAVGAAFAGGVVFGDNSVARHAYQVPGVAVRTTYVMSVFVRMDDASAPVPGGNSAGNDFGLVCAGTLVASGMAVRSLGDDLYRVSVVYTTPSPIGVNNWGIAKYTGQSAKTFKVTGYQVEQKSHITSYVATSGATATRSPETLTIPTAGVLSAEGPWSIEWRAKTNVSGVTWRVPIALVDSSALADRYLDVALNSANRPYYSFYSGAYVYSVAASTALVDPTGEHAWVVTYDGATLVLYVDGAPVLTRQYHLDGNFPAQLKVGYWPGPLYFWNGWIDDLRISSRVRTDAEIAAAYASNQPLPRDADTTYKLTLNGSLYPVERCYVPLGTFWSGDWDAPEKEAWAETSGRDRLELLRNSDYSTSQVIVNTTLYDLAVVIFAGAGFAPGEYYVDLALQAFTVPYAWFDTQSRREALRKIAEACMGQLYCDRAGLPRLVGHGYSGASVSALTKDNYFDKDRPAKYSQIRNVITVVTSPLRPAAVAIEMYQSSEAVSIGAGDMVTVTCYYNEKPCLSTDAVSTLLTYPVDAHIESVTYYAFGATVTVHSPTNAGTFTLQVDAKPLRVLNKDRIVARGQDSIDENSELHYTFPENPLIQSRAMAETIANTLLASFKDARRDIKLVWVGNPALLLGDKFSAIDYGSTSEDFFLIRQEIAYDGSLTSTINGRKA